MTAADIDRILDIEGRSFPKPWTRAQFENELSNPVSYSYTVQGQYEGKPLVAAYIIFWVVHYEAHILDVAVAPEFRRTGIGTWLLQTVLELMRDNMVYEVFLEVRKSNTAARDLYGKLGFREAFERKNYYGDEDAIVMTLRFEENAADF